MRFREDQLENYQGLPIEYSISDYHHGPERSLRRSTTRASLSKSIGRPSVSQYSILNENSQPKQSHSYQRQPSVAETERIYDPFRTSRNQISRAQAGRARITVRRGPSSLHDHRVSRTSLNRRMMSKASIHHGATAARGHQTDVYNRGSSPRETRNPSRVQSSAKARSMSQYSSRRSLSHNIVLHASTSSRRGVIFAQMKRPTNLLHQRPHGLEREGAPASLQSSDRDRAPMDLQERYTPDKMGQASSQPQSSLAPDSPQSAASTVIVRSRKVPTVDEENGKRKERPTSHYWREDTRQVSSELEKACDEAFNRYSAASTAITGMIETPDRNTSSPATSIGIHADQCNPVDATWTAGRLSVQGRPLPLPSPAYEDLGSFTLQELAKTRALLQKRAADTSLTGHFDDIIAHLDRLMQPSTMRLSETTDQRSVSAPGAKYDFSHSHDEFEKLLSRGPFALRSSSDSVTPGFHNHSSLQRHDLDGRLTVRAVESSPANQKPISPTKPLTIKKKPSDLTEKEPRQPRQQRSRADVKVPRNSTTTQQKGGEWRSAGLSLLESNLLEPIKEDEKETTTRGKRDSKVWSGDGKKRGGWFRRHDRAQRSQDIDQGPPPPLPPKDYLFSPRQMHGEFVRSGNHVTINKRASDVPSDESRTSETKKTRGGRFFKIFGSKRESKESKSRSSGGILSSILFF